MMLFIISNAIVASLTGQADSTLIIEPVEITEGGGFYMLPAALAQDERCAAFHAAMAGLPTAEFDPATDLFIYNGTEYTREGLAAFLALPE